MNKREFVKKLGKKRSDQQFITALREAVNPRVYLTPRQFAMVKSGLRQLRNSTMLGDDYALQLLHLASYVNGCRGTVD